MTANCPTTPVECVSLLGYVRPEEDSAVPVPPPSGLTFDQIVACERFSQKVFGGPLFDHRPAHHGQHGHNCPVCTTVLSEMEQRPVKAPAAPRQPWELEAA